MRSQAVVFALRSLFSISPRPPFEKSSFEAATRGLGSSQSSTAIGPIRPIVLGRFASTVAGMAPGLGPSPARDRGALASSRI